MRERFKDNEIMTDIRDFIKYLLGGILAANPAGLCEELLLQ